MNESSISAAIRNLVKGMMAGVHTCMPAKVESYDYAKQKAAVKPLLKRTYADNQSVEFPVITDVPVVFPRSGLASLTFPVAVGDTVLLVFSERSMDQWLIKGGIAETKLEKQFDLSDAIAIPGIIPFTDSSYASNNTDVELTFKGQKIVIKSNGDIEIGVGTLRSLIDERIQAAFNGHGHEYVSPGGPAMTSKPTNAGIAQLIPATVLILGTGTLEVPVTTSKVKAQ